MGPHESDVGGSGPTFEGPDTRVSPSNLESFGAFVRELAQGWSESGEHGYAKQLQEHEANLVIGTFPAAEQLRSAYDTAHGNMLDAAGTLHALLVGLAEATEKAANNYKNSSALADASVQDIEALLDESLSPVVEDAGEQPSETPTDDPDSSDDGSEAT